MADKRATYKKLGKLHQHELDRLTKRKAELEDQIHTFIFLIEQLDREAEVEKEKATQDPTLAPYLGSYLSLNETRKEEFHGALSRLEAQLDELQELISDAFSALKQVDIAHTNLEQEIVEEEAKQQQKELDDLSMMRQPRN